MDCRRKCLVDFNAEKTQLVLFNRPNNTGATDAKMDRDVFEKKSSFKLLLLTFSSKLDWCSYITSIAKTASKIIGSLIRSVYMKVLSPELALYLYKSTIRPSIEYCCHVCYLELLHKLQKWICTTVGPLLVASLELLAHR